MNRTPPKSLPRAFRGIWEALKEADEKAASRQALSRDLGVATHTLQRILVSGNVPSFKKGSNTRIRRAWARTLARLAHRLGRDPRAWVEAAGIEWEPDIEAAVQAVLRSEAAVRTVRRGKVETPAPGEPGAKEEARTRARPSGTRVAIVLGSPLASPLRGGPSFLESYARRLAGSLEPGRSVEFNSLSEGETLLDLLGPDPSHDFAAGVIETVARRAAGLEFQEIPGWRARIDALALRPERSTARPIRWRDLKAGFPVPVLALDDVSRRYLMAHRGLLPQKISAQTGADIPDLADLSSRMIRAGAGMLVFAGLEWSCRQARDALSASGEFTVEPLRGNAAASYPISIAMPARASSWAKLLDAAREAEIFGSAAEETAQLYAETAVEMEFASRTGGAAPMKPAHFPAATPAFQRAYCARVLELLTQDRPEAGWVLEDLPPAGRRDRIVETASMLAPAEWRERLEEAIRELPAYPIIEAPSTAGASRFCRSCSASLLEEHNRGVSDRYCRYCSDESGRLKPRDEVRTILAGWIAHWQGGLDENEAIERAERLMSAMPAWSRN